MFSLNALTLSVSSPIRPPSATQVLLWRQHSEVDSRDAYERLPHDDVGAALYVTLLVKQLSPKVFALVHTLMTRVFAYTRLHSLSPPTGIQEQEAESGTVFDLAGNFRDLKKLVDYAMKHDKTQICMVRLKTKVCPPSARNVYSHKSSTCTLRRSRIYILLRHITMMYNHDV